VAAEGEAAAGAGSRMPPLQAFEIFRTLAAHGLDYVVIGGYALAAHGVIRGTKDVDIYPDPRRANLKRLLAALQAMDAVVAGIEDFESREWPVRLDLDELAQRGNWVLRTRYGRLDVMQSLEGIGDYATLRAEAVKPAIPGLDERETPWFAGLDDIVAMKRAAGRDQDLIDIAELERARGSDC
jgi:hypothetical protein